MAAIAWCLMLSFAIAGLQPPSLSEAIFAPEVRSSWKERPSERRRVQMQFANVLTASERAITPTKESVRSMEWTFADRTRPIQRVLDELKSTGHVGFVGYRDPVNQSWSVEIDAFGAAALEKAFATNGFRVRILPDKSLARTMPGDESPSVEMLEVAVPIHDAKALSQLFSNAYAIRVNHVKDDVAYGKCSRATYERLKDAKLIVVPGPTVKAPETEVKSGKSAAPSQPTGKKTFEALLIEGRKRPD